MTCPSIRLLFITRKIPLGTKESQDKKKPLIPLLSSSFQHERIEKRNQLDICKRALAVHQLHAALVRVDGKSGVAQRSRFEVELNR